MVDANQNTASGQPKVSVIIPVYNDERFVKRALKSCTAQTLEDIEIVCVDDGSQDGSLAVLRAAAKADYRVNVIALERNGGSHNARLAGVRAAKGEHVVFLDADDELTRMACEMVVEEYSKAPASILHFAMRVRGGRGVSDDAVRDMATWTTPEEVNLYGREVLDRTFVDHACAFNVCGKAFEAKTVKAAFELLGEITSDSGEDALEYFAIAYVGGSYRGVPKQCLYVYHLADGLSERLEMNAEQFERVLRLATPVEGMRSFLESRGLFEDYGDVYRAHRADQLRVTLKEWDEHVNPQEKAACLARVVEVWPLDDVVDGVCALGTEALDMLKPLIGDYPLSDRQIWKCGYADGAKAARAEIEASGTYRLGRVAGALPRKLLALRGR